MSDPVTNVEIEDVLSSIRKLVADDARVAPAAPRRSPEPDRLVLTPALRVKEAPAPTEEDAQPEEAAAQSPVPETVPGPRVVEEHPIEAIPGDARLADFGEVEGVFPDIDDLETPVSDDFPDEDDEVEQVEQVEQGSARLELGRLIEKEVAAALNVEAELDEGAVRTAEATDFGIEIANSEELPFEDAETDDVAEASADAGVLEEDEFAQDDAASFEPETELQSPPQTLEDKVAALGRLVARDSNDFEEERDSPDADELTAVSEPMTWPGTATNTDQEPTVEPEFHSERVRPTVLRSDTVWPASDQMEDVPEELAVEPAAEVVEPEAVAVEPEDVELPGESYDLAASAPATGGALQIDEEMLRDLVGEIVRQELQGALGERITRNVRKLVRREIHRMLISQELE